MQTFFYLSLGVLAVLALLNSLSAVLGFADFGLDLDLDFDFDLGAFLPVRPMLIIIFITVFGGAGTILYGRIPSYLAVVCASAAAFLAVFAVNKLVVTPLKKLGSKESARDEDIIGIEADVTEKIFSDGYGQITFFYDGNTISGPAKGAPKTEYPAGTKVIVVNIDSNVYVVEETGICGDAGFNVESL